MSDIGDKKFPSFGGSWTQEKLGILEHYLDAYTTALKNRSFKMVYIDAFAGTGYVEIPPQDNKDMQEFIQGSASIALDIRDKPFDRLIFVERDKARYRELKRLEEQSPQREIRIINSDANQYLMRLQEDWDQWRGVLFLDPFATEVAWSTIERIAGFKALDTWILFPVSAITRMLPRSRLPDEIDPRWATRLTTVFGDDSWRELYQERQQQSLFGEPGVERDPGSHGLLPIYQKQLRKLFGQPVSE